MKGHPQRVGCLLFFDMGRSKIWLLNLQGNKFILIIF
jgi:hypothetical protein